MNPIVPLPSASDLITQVGSSSAPLFQSLLPLAYLEAGWFVGALIVVFIIAAIISGIRAFIHPYNNEVDEHNWNRR